MVSPLRNQTQGEQFVNQNLNQSARRNAIYVIGVDFQKEGKEPIDFEFTRTRKSRQGLMSHLIKTEATVGKARFGSGWLSRETGQ